MGAFMMVIFATIWLMALEGFRPSNFLYMKVTGNKIINLVKVMKLGKTEASIEDLIKKALNKVLECLRGKTVAITKALFIIAKFKDSGKFNGRMAKNTKGNGKIAK